jgi:predicted nucleotidyltransferase
VKIENSILRSLAYFDVFNYPITSTEIRSFLQHPVNENDLDRALEQLLATHKIFQLDEFYSLQNDHSLVARRRMGNNRAAGLIVKAQKIAQRLYKFPYVRAIAVSGSVSKNFADENADIDYFIITKTDRLWIARTLLHLFKKNPFLKNRNEYYCMNYFVDEANLIIEEKNIYTATELYTIIPMAGNGSMKKFFYANTWSHCFFPNRFLPVIKEEKINFPWYKKLGEFIFDNKLGNWLDDYLFRLTTRRWKKKEDEQRVNTKGEKMGLKTGKHFSKPNPIFFHDWFMKKYESKLQEIIRDE